MRQRTWVLAVMALLMIVFAGCKSESSSPTSPTGTTTQPPTSTSGGTTPPVSPNVVVTVSNPNPVTNSTSVITATVTLNGQPVPNGTAVEFATTPPGSFTESGTAALLRTTANGVATATLTSNAAGTVPVSVTVNNVTKSVTVKFSDQIIITPPDTTVVVTGITPSSGRPQGGEQITITGRNFKSPARVLFDTGTGTPKEGFVVSVTSTQIVVVTPAVDLGPSAQTLAATVTVVSSAGNSDEQRAVSPVKFTFALQVLTPIITTVTPNSGPIDGGTRVTIVGEAFQTQVQVLFGAAEAQVISINFNQIIAISPTGSATSPGGSGAVTGFVDVTVVNVNSNKRATLANAFRYVPKAIITAAGPTQGPTSGGTRVLIDGNGFNDPVAVVIGGIAAQPIKVTGTEVTALSSATTTPCTKSTGPISVTNIDNGDSATGPTFTYLPLIPSIISINPSTVTPGSSITVTVANAPPGFATIKINGLAVLITSSTTDSNGNAVFTVTVPASGFTFTSAACTVNGIAGTQPQPTSTTVTFASLSFPDCTTNGNPISITVNPTDTTCTVPAQGVVTSPTSCINAGTATVGGTGTTTTASVTIMNQTVTGATVQPLNITGVTSSSTEFTVGASPSTASIPPGSSKTFNLTIGFTPTSAGSKTATITFTAANGATSPTVCVNATANPAPPAP